MERAERVSIEYIVNELERLKVEVQRLEALLIPLVKSELSEEEIDEIEREAREFDDEDWVDADELDSLLGDEE